MSFAEQYPHLMKAIIANKHEGFVEQNVIRLFGKANSAHYKIADALDKTMRWKHTPQGHAFWKTLHREMALDNVNGGAKDALDKAEKQLSATNPPTTQVDDVAKTLLQTYPIICKTLSKYSDGTYTGAELNDLYTTTICDNTEHCFRRIAALMEAAIVWRRTQPYPRHIWVQISDVLRSSCSSADKQKALNDFEHTLLDYPQSVTQISIKDVTL